MSSNLNKEKSNIQFSSVEEISNIARENLPIEYKNCPWKALSERGKELLTNDLTMDAYFASYSHWHKGKIFIALNKIPFSLFREKFNVIDWGCGQGMGTLSLYDFLSNHKLEENLSEVFLIDPSEEVTKKAKFYVSARCRNLTINSISKYFHEISHEEIKLKYDYPCLHIFSNVIDVTGIDFHDLAQKVATTTANDNFLLIASPCYQQGNRNILSFISYFNSYKTLFKAIESNKNIKGYTYNITNILLNDMPAERIFTTNYYPPVEYKAAYISDIMQTALGDNIKPYFNSLESFRVYAPFDVGSTVSEDYHPILSVINNIITRGLPTKAPITLEDSFAKLGFSNKKLTLGSIYYEAVDKEEITKFLSSSNKIVHSLNFLIYTPIAVARIQKVVLEAIFANKISLEDKEWNILLEEHDVPCGALAVKILQELFEHITQLSKDYTELGLPKINLTIISSYVDSPLHLNSTVYLKPSKEILEKTYDFIIDYSSDFIDETQISSFFSSPYNVKNKNYYTLRSIISSEVERYIYTSDEVIYQSLLGEHSEELTSHLIYFLQNIFRKNSFRPGQIPILNRAMQKKSVIGLLPTGGGKSLTYQIAAILQPGITIVVDPLRALMQDQYNGLKKVGIDCVSYIESGQTALEKTKQEYEIEQSKSLFAFLSPERLSMYDFRERLKNMKEMNVYFSYGVIDEVHCLSEWGHDFRFSYLHIGRVLYNYARAKKGYVSLFGLTATASFDVLADVERELSAEGAFPLDSETIVRFENSNRLELQYRIIEVQDDKKKIRHRSDREKTPLMPWEINNIKRKKIDSLPKELNRLCSDINTLSEKEKIDSIKNSFLIREGIVAGGYYDEIQNSDIAVRVNSAWLDEKNAYEHGSIVFCPHRKGLIGVEDIARDLSDTLNNSHISSFVGGDKVENQDDFLSNKSPLMVATKAFGMGIDKPNIRFTINVNMPSSLESFVQEAGRAGRDRKMALATILYNPYLDYDVINFFYGNNFKGIDIEKKLLYYLLAISNTEIKTNYTTQGIVNKGFLPSLLDAKEGETIYFNISYNFKLLDEVLRSEIAKLLGFMKGEEVDIYNARLPETWSTVIEKAMYRLSCLTIIDDYTRNYKNSSFFVTATRKADGEYYKNLTRFLTRYYTLAKAEEETELAKNYKGENEIHKCLSYLTEFVYTQIAEKRKRAMEDIDTFCQIGINPQKNWLELNEELKDFIYYYFNSKYAQIDYKSTTGESFSLLADSDRGKISSFDLLFKYMRVVETEVYHIGSPKDSIKHLQGAIRLIRRSATNDNGSLLLLNIFCALYLATEENKADIAELEKEYALAYIRMRKDENSSRFYDYIDRYHQEIGRLNYSRDFLKTVMANIPVYELSIHSDWIKQFNYTR